MGPFSDERGWADRCAKSRLKRPISWLCVRPQGGFEVKCPLYVSKLYPYTLQSHPKPRPQVTTWPVHAIANLLSPGGSTRGYPQLLSNGSGRMSACDWRACSNGCSGPTGQTYSVMSTGGAECDSGWGRPLGHCNFLTGQSRGTALSFKKKRAR